MVLGAAVRALLLLDRTVWVGNPVGQRCLMLTIVDAIGLPWLCRVGQLGFHRYKAVYRLKRFRQALRIYAEVVR